MNYFALQFDAANGKQLVKGDMNTICLLFAEMVTTEINGQKAYRELYKYNLYFCTENMDASVSSIRLDTEAFDATADEPARICIGHDITVSDGAVIVRDVAPLPL